MFFLWPYQRGFTEQLSSAVKKEISKQVAEKVYLELRTGKYLEDAYVRETAIYWAKHCLDVEIFPDQSSDGFKIKARRNNGTNR